MHQDFITLAKESIQQLHPYEPGKPIEEVARELGLDKTKIIKLASNENPLGCSSKVTEAIQSGLPEIFRYPDGNAFEAKQALAYHLKIDPQTITLTNGSDEILRLIALSYTNPGDEIIFSQYGFAVYKIAALSVSAHPVEIPAQNWGCDLDAMRQSITTKTRIIYIANPNNPTGTCLSYDILKQFIQSVPSNIIVVLDEAYVEYMSVSPQESPSWINTFPNLIIVRTFSKAYGLAGLRVGYGIANHTITNILNRVRPAFNVGNIVQKALIAALEDQNFVQESRRINQAGMNTLTQTLENMQLPYIPSSANFVTFDTQQSAIDVFQNLLRQGIIVRPLGPYGMPSHLRVSIGTTEENKHFIKALSETLEHAI